MSHDFEVLKSGQKAKNKENIAQLSEKETKHWLEVDKNNHLCSIVDELKKKVGDLTHE
jgi:hypothetical protein